MDDGLYESLVNEQLQRELQSAADLVSVIAHVDNADQPLVLARYVRAALERKLTLTRDPSARIALVNALLSDIAHAEEAVAPPARQLLSLESAAGCQGSLPERDAPTDAALGLCSSHQRKG